MFASGNWERFADRINCSLSKYRFWFTGSCQAGLSITMNRKSGRRTSPNAFLRGGPAGNDLQKKVVTRQQLEFQHNLSHIGYGFKKHSFVIDSHSPIQLLLMLIFSTRPDFSISRFLELRLPIFQWLNPVPWPTQPSRQPHKMLKISWFNHLIINSYQFTHFFHFSS